MTGGELRAMARLLLDRERRVVAFTQPMFGTSITTRLDRPGDGAAAAPALSIAASQRDGALALRMSAAALQGHIRYRFAFRDGLEFALPQTGEQRVTSAAGRAWFVDICADCGPGCRAIRRASRARRRPDRLAAERPSAAARDRRAGGAHARFSDARKMELLLRCGRGPISARSISPAISRRWRR